MSAQTTTSPQPVTSFQTLLFGTHTLAEYPAAGLLAWRNESGARVSPYYKTVEAAQAHRRRTEV